MDESFAAISTGGAGRDGCVASVNAGDVMLLIAALALLVLCGVMTWVCVLPPRRDYSADDLEIAQQLELEGRGGDAAEVA